MSVGEQRVDRIFDSLSEVNPDALTADGFDEAYIGYASQFNSPPVAVYDTDKCVSILMNRDGMNQIEAMEFFEFNVLGSWCGENTPMFLVRKDGNTE